MLANTLIRGTIGTYQNRHCPRAAVNGRGRDTATLEVVMPFQRTTRCVYCGALCPRNRNQYCSRDCYRDDPASPAHRRVDPTDRFWQKVSRDGTETCWEWLATRDAGGYGRFWNDGRLVAAHRYSVELVRGPIPDGLDVDHLCRNRGCVNPDHLEVVSRQINVRRGIGPAAKNAGKTHCIHGHEFTEANTKIWKGYGRVMRQCRACYRVIDDRRRGRQTRDGGTR